MNILTQTIASILVIMGIYYYGKKSIYGAICAGIGDILWILIGVCNGMPPLTVLNIILLFINIKNIYYWNKE